MTAGNAGHPSGDVPHSPFIATLAEDSVAGPDANAETFGNFSRALTRKAQECGTAGWAIGGELNVATPEWGTLLEAKMFDPDAVRKIEQNRLTPGQRPAFNTWLTATKGHYAALYFQLLVSMRALNTFLRWVIETQTNIWAFQDGQRTDFENADFDTYDRNATSAD
ncbi:hypothetical protein [Streptomyces sp. HUAS TT7]|uniref:hypothetical protein n=1 Tax=Streptomyces sp. HUAS TT7 TaxID=3447507 RepID=UPI003F65DA65